MRLDAVGRACSRAVTKKLCAQTRLVGSLARPDFCARQLKIQTSKLRNWRRLVPLLLDWFAANARDLPWRRTRDPYAIWVSEIMLQQTQVKTVIPYWERWMRELPTIEAAAESQPGQNPQALGRTRLLHPRPEFAEGGAANRRTTRCHSKSRRRRGNETQIKRKLETPHVVSYKFPENFEDVLALPGIGRYTAGAICSIAFNQPTPILDGNVIRVLTRIFGIAENPKEKETNARLWKLAEELVACGEASDHPKQPT